MSSSNTIYRSANLVDSLGVNTHIDWQDTGSSYANVDVVISSLSYLGVSLVRDCVPYAGWTLPEYVDIAKMGIRFDIILSEPTIDIESDLAQITNLTAVLPNSVASIEGPNEFNNNSYSYNGVSSLNDPSWGFTVDQALSSAVAANPALADVPVIAASMSNAGVAQIQQEGNLSSVLNSSNWHVYFGGGDQPGFELAAAVVDAQQTAPGKPVTITESGYYTAVNAMDWGGGGVTQPVQAIETVNLLLDSYADGVQSTYLYELLDNISNPSSTDLEDSFGLFEADGTPKLAAVAIHDLTQILSDTGSTAATFATGTLNSSVTGLPETGSTMVMEKSDGAYYEMIWNEPQIWNQTTESQIEVTPTPITVNLGAIYQTVNEFDPITGSTVIATFNNVSQITLDISTDPIILDIEPNSLSTPACFCRGTHILTTRGEIPVEDLRVGDLAITFLGAGAVIKPVRWLGHAHVDLLRHPRPDEGRPIRIRAGALADGRPSRDLLVSPGHRFPINGVLIAASDLINGASIVPEAPDQVEYWHVELDEHDILLADGLEAESYLNTGNRYVFESGNVVALHPSQELDSDGLNPCLPYGQADIQLRRRLIARAKELGWQRVRDPAPWLDVSGRRIEPVRDGNRYRFELPEASTKARLCSRVNRPSDSDAESSDNRRLGLSLHQLALHADENVIEVALDDSRLDAGFSYVERPADGGACWRWTEGAALLPLAELMGRAVTAVEFTIQQGLWFWVEPATIGMVHPSLDCHALAG